MRIVSQNGKFSIPFENCVITCESNIIHCEVMNGNQFIVGEYSTVEKAQKAMDMLHQMYIGIMPSIFIDNDSVFDTESIECLKNSTTGVIIRPANVGDVEVHMLPRMFRFPTDNEIEVYE